jgi:outer membrane protein assembly factor BamB
VSDGRVFVVTVENELVVLAADDGRRLWVHNGIPETASLLGSASPAVEGEVVVVAYSSGELYALTVETGRPLWSDNLASTSNLDAVSTLADIRGWPVIDRGRVYAASHSGRMAAIDLRSGERAWEQELGSTHTLWVAGDYVYILSNDNELLCLTRDEGKVRWVRLLPSYENEKKKKDSMTWAGPVLGGDRLIVLSSDGGALSISPYTGEPLGRDEMSAGGYFSPVIADNSLYVLTDDAKLSAYR